MIALKRTFGDLFGFTDLADTGADAGIRAMGTAKRSADHTSFDAVIAFVYAAFATTETCFRDGVERQWGFLLS